MKLNSSFFTPIDLDHAKNLVLTPEDTTTESRWEKESYWTIETLKLFSTINETSVVLDWGCGIGRISKLLINTFNCSVVGYDTEPKMLDYARKYVNSDKFTASHCNNLLENLPKNYFTHVIAIWVFQHSDKLQFEIPLIYQSLKSNSELFVVDMFNKCIPADSGFYSDNIDSKQILEKFYNPLILGKIPTKFTTQKIQDMSWWGLLQRKNK